MLTLLISKCQVEHHNRQIQQSFSQGMDGAFSSMQRCVQQHGAKHHDMMSSCSHAIGKSREPCSQGNVPERSHNSSLTLHPVSRSDGLLVMNEAALEGALTTVESFVGSVGPLVAEGVARCQEKVQQQEALCLQDKENLLQLLVRNRRAPVTFHTKHEVFKG